jgi:hypothetical protein
LLLKIVACFIKRELRAEHQRAKGFWAVTHASELISAGVYHFSGWDASPSQVGFTVETGPCFILLGAEGRHVWRLSQGQTLSTSDSSIFTELYDGCAV